jgi:putative membrane protein (TIGR04086 family)
MEKNMTGGLQAMHFVKAFIMSALITAMLLFLCAFLVLKSGMEEKTLGIILAAVDAIGVFIGGLYLGKKSGKQKFLWGLIFGILYFLVYLLLSFLISGPTLTIPGAIKSFAVMALGGMIGGMVS